jgi:MYXO-CTERM domain-containing protein
VALAAAVSTVGGCSTTVSSPASSDAGVAPSTAAPPTVQLTHGAHPLARPEFDIGPLDPAKRIENLSVIFKLSPQQLHDRDALLADLINAGSPRYHQWLSTADYAARFGAQADDIHRAAAWLAQQGLEVHDVSPLGARLTFSGTVATLQSAFRTEMRRYQVGNQTHYAMSSAPSIPADLADVILGVLGTHDFYPHHVKPSVVRVDPGAVCPNGDTYCHGNGLGPPDWAAVYDVNPLYNATPAINGTGTTIGIVGISEIAQSDINAFRTRFGLPASTVTMNLVPNTGVAEGGNGAGLEAILDTEWSGGIAPDANIVYFYTGASDGNVNDAVFYAIEQNVTPILSESFAGCEIGETMSDADALQVFGSAANLLGMTYLAASGDDGAAACLDFGFSGLYVNMPASFPGVTAVGGTEFPTGSLTYVGGTATGYSALEETWNESDSKSSPAAGGGGISVVFSRPSYQSSIPTCPIVGSLPVSGINAANMREIPDLSLTAAASNNGYFIECTYSPAVKDCTAAGGAPTIIQIGGTSASTPSFAGVLALVTQATGGGRLGNVNPLLYTLQSTTPTAFHDITLGNNEMQCAPSDPGCPAGGLYGYAAATGYDCATGLGSLDTNNFVQAWKKLTGTSTALTAVPTATTEGGKIALNATVSVNGTNNNNLGGTVTFTFQSYLSNGDPDLSWTLASAPITNGSKTGGSVSEPSISIPPGMVNPADQGVDVVAMYGGDANHLASTSPKVHITFSALNLCVTPGTDNLAAGGALTFTAQGGVQPYQWLIDIDSTCTPSGTGCSTLNETTGAFVAGTGEAGYVLVQLLDADGAETFSEITVGSPTGQAPWVTNDGFIVTACPCVPTTTSCPVGDNCGTVPNGCGVNISCGPACTAPQTCGGGGTPNVCGCTPTLSSCPAGDNCGTLPNGCGGTVSCGGPCTAPQTCGGGGTANVCGCTPTTISCPVGDNCGTIPNGCGGTVSCGGFCNAPQTCGGGGTPNVCGCTPTVTSCPAGDNCGTISNGCGGTVTCGPACTAPQTCGGGGTPNVCGVPVCTPITTCPAGDNCGTIPNGCGGTVPCGPACTSPQTCGGGGTPNVCGCTPTVTSCPAGDNCGTIPNGCGGTVTCGPGCTAPETCGGGGTPNVCGGGCVPATTCPAGFVCGTASNGCGGTIPCGTCSGGETCSGNTCVASDAGTDSGVDSGSVDSGSSSDSGTTTDASTADGSSDASTGDSGEKDSGEADSSTATDSGETTDSGSTHDSGSDSGSVATDSGAEHDGASDAALDAALDGGSGTVEGGGCSCKTAGEAPGSSRLASLGALALFVGVGVRRRRRR